MVIARQSTARTVMVGPVLDADGVAVTDGVVGDFKISKNGGAPAALNGSATLTHRHTGMYSLALTASDLDTVGQAEVTLDDSTNACPVKEITIIEEAVYDISFASSATGAVPVASIANNAITASAIASDAITAAKIATGAIDADAIASDAITAAKIASSAITSAKFAAGAIDASAIADNAIDAGAIASNALALAKVATDLRQAFGLNLSGTLSGTHSDTTADLGAGAPTEDVSGQTLFFPAHQLSRVISSYNTGTGVATFDSIGVTLANADVWHLFATAPGSGGGGGGDATEAKQDTIIALIGTPSVDLATDLAAVKSDTAAILTDTADMQPKLGSPAGASVSADIAAVKAQTAAIEADTQDIQSRLPAALVNSRMDCTIDGTGMEAGAVTAVQSGLATAAELAKVPKSDGTASWNATALAAIQSEANDALVAYDPPTKAELDAAVANVSVDEIQATALADLFNTDSGTTYASAVAGSVVKEIADNAGGASLTVQDIVDGVWDEPMASHADSGSTGEALSAAGGAGDPWITALPGSYTTGQAGYIIGTNLNATVSSRASQSSVDDVPTNAELATALDPLPTAAENATAVWGAGTRLLTAGTNIVLAKGTGVTGFNDLSAAQVNAEVDTALSDYDPPTRAELTSDTNSVLTAVGDVPTNAELATALDALPTAAENADAVWDEQVDGSVTARQSVRLANSVLGGKASGLETTSVAYRDLADAKNRVAATVDESGNRSAVTLDLT